MKHILAVIKQELSNGAIDKALARQFIGIALFGAYTGQRSHSTSKQLRVEQFREALELNKPVI